MPVEHHLHVIPDIRVPVLVDGEAGAGVQQLDVHDPHLSEQISISSNNSLARNTPITQYFIAFIPSGYRKTNASFLTHSLLILHGLTHCVVGLSCLPISVVIILFFFT